MARDTQRQAVYDWEKHTFGNIWEDRPLTRSEIMSLVHRIHLDVRKAGGVAAAPWEIKFDWSKRKGACANFGYFNFSAKSTFHVALHEIAHSLTMRSYATMGKEMQVYDDAGHGPRFVACLMALTARYKACDLDHMIRTTKDFPSTEWGPKRIEIMPDRQGNLARYSVRTRQETRKRIVYSPAALNYWLVLLSKVPVDNPLV